VKIEQLLIAQSPSNAFAKNYENQIMLLELQLKMFGCFSRHSVVVVAVVSI